MPAGEVPGLRTGTGGERDTGGRYGREGPTGGPSLEGRDRETDDTRLGSERAKSMGSSDPRTLRGSGGRGRGRWVHVTVPRGLPLLDRFQVEHQQLDPLLLPPVSEHLASRQVQLPPWVPVVLRSLRGQLHQQEVVRELPLPVTPTRCQSPRPQTGRGRRSYRPRRQPFEWGGVRRWGGPHKHGDVATRPSSIPGARDVTRVNQEGYSLHKPT